jgi:hypothetical protein
MAAFDDIWMAAFDDIWMESIKTVADIILRNRAYQIANTSVSNVAVSKKLRNDDRDCRHLVSLGPVVKGEDQ